MAGQYAPLPFSYISAGVKAPKTGLRKDDGVYGTNEHVIRDAAPDDLGASGVFSSAAITEEPSVTVNPLYGAQVAQAGSSYPAPTGLPRQGKLQPELPKIKNQPSFNISNQQLNSGGDNQKRQDAVYSQYNYNRQPQGEIPGGVVHPASDEIYGNWQDHQLNVYNGPQNQQPPIYTQPQHVAIAMSLPDVNANVRRNRETSYPPRMNNEGFSYDSVPRTLAPVAPVPAAGVYQISRNMDTSEMKPVANSFGVDNKLSQPQYGFVSHPPRQNYTAGNEAGSSQAVFVAKSVPQSEIPKPSEFAFERPDFSLYAGNAKKETENPAPTNVQSGASYPLQPLKASTTTSAQSTSRPKSDRDESGCCCSGKVGCIIFGILLTALVCLGAGFVAGWFGHIAASSSSTSGSSSSTTTQYMSSVGNVLTTTSTFTQGPVQQPSSTTTSTIIKTSTPTTTTTTTTTTLQATTTTPTTTTSPTTTTTTTTPQPIVLTNAANLPPSPSDSAITTSTLR